MKNTHKDQLQTPVVFDEDKADREYNDKAKRLRPAITSLLVASIGEAIAWTFMIRANMSEQNFTKFFHFDLPNVLHDSSINFGTVAELNQPLLKVGYESLPYLVCVLGIYLFLTRITASIDEIRWVANPTKMMKKLGE